MKLNNLLGVKNIAVARFNDSFYANNFLEEHDGKIISIFGVGDDICIVWKDDEE